MTIKNTLQSLAQASDKRSKMGRLREVLPDIEAAKNAGVSNAKIVEALNAEHDLQLTVKTFEMMLYRLRKEASDSLSERGQVSEPVNTQGPVSTSSTAIETPKEKPSDEPEEPSKHTSLKNRGEAVADKYMSSNPLLKKLRKDKE